MAIKVSNLVFKRSADLDTTFAVIIRGNVRFVITCPREDIFIKEFVGNQNFIFRIVAMILC